MKKFQLFLALVIALNFACTDDDSGEPDVELALFSLAAAGVFNNFCGNPVFYEPGTYSLQIGQGEFFWFSFPVEFNRTYQIDITEASGQNVAVEEMVCVSGQVSNLVNSSATGQVENFEFFNLDTRAVFFYCTEGCNNAFQFTIPSTGI